MAPPVKKTVRIQKIDRYSILLNRSMLTYLSPHNLWTVLQKRSQESINSRLALVMKSGKFTLGYKTSLKCLRSGKGWFQNPLVLLLLT